mgnify:CR=1 FL=1
MEFKQFIESIKEEVERRMPEYKVDFNHVLKNNGVELVGLVIRKENEKISPNIYLDNFR